MSTPNNLNENAQTPGHRDWAYKLAALLAAEDHETGRIPSFYEAAQLIRDEFAEQTQWQPIETAPKDEVETDGGHKLGPWIIAHPVHNEVGRVRFWRNGDRSNWISDYGFVANPTYWMPLPSAPKAGEEAV